MGCNPVSYTHLYFAYLINKAKRIYYPRVSGNTMSFYRVRSLDELNCGSFDIKEHDMTKEYTQADGRALMIVPGLSLIHIYPTLLHLLFSCSFSEHSSLISTMLLQSSAVAD